VFKETSAKSTQQPSEICRPRTDSNATMSQPGDYDAVRKDIVAQLKKPDYDDGSAGPVFVRLAW
jgi:hypothetical protein